MKETVMIGNTVNHKHVFITLKVIPMSSMYLTKLVICSLNKHRQ